MADFAHNWISIPYESGKSLCPRCKLIKLTYHGGKSMFFFDGPGVQEYLHEEPVCLGEEDTKSSDSCICLSMTERKDGKHRS